MIDGGSGTADGRVSVITIFLDEARFLAEAIDSVLAQTYQDWELFLVDDGSTDGSTELARGYADRHPDRIRYLNHPRHENRGMSAARNLGLRHARGEFVALLDGDDVWLPEKLERQVEILRASPDDAMVYGPTMEWFDWSDTEPARRRPGPEDSYRRLGVRPGRSVPPPRQLERILGPSADSPGTCSVLMRREALEAVGGFEDGFTGLHEDQVVFAKLLLRYPVFVMARCLDLYRQHEASHCHVAQLHGERAEDRPNPAGLRYLLWLQDYVTSIPAPGRVPALVRRELWLYRHPGAASVVRGLRKARAWLSALPGRVLRSSVVMIGRIVLPSSARERAWAWWQRGRAFESGDPHTSGEESR